MSDIDIAELKHLHGSWVVHKYTETFAKKIAVERKDSFAALRAACMQTTDAKVMHAYTRWHVLTDCLKEIQEGPHDDQQG